MTNSDIEITKALSKEILASLPQQPFLCLPMSALLYANLVDKHEIPAKLITGNMRYGDEYIFKQDFSLSKGDHAIFKLWAGHAWVEIDDWIWDLSFFRTLYSSKFTKPFKQHLISVTGEGKGIIAIPTKEFAELNIQYEPIDQLSNEMATGIINGIPELLKSFQY